MDEAIRAAVNLMYVVDGENMPIVSRLADDMFSKCRRLMRKMRRERRGDDRMGTLGELLIMLYAKCETAAREITDRDLGQACKRGLERMDVLLEELRYADIEARRCHEPPSLLEE